jgi:hypothetical protein
VDDWANVGFLAFKAEMGKLPAIDYRSAGRDEIEYFEEIATRRRVEWQIRIDGARCSEGPATLGLH